MAIRLALLRHHYRSDWEWTDDELWDAVDDARRLAQGALAGRRRAGRAGRRRRCSPRWPTTSTRPTAVAAVDAWVAATLGTDGLADTTDPDAAMTHVRRLLDAGPRRSPSGSTGPADRAQPSSVAARRLR